MYGGNALTEVLEVCACLLSRHPGWKQVRQIGGELGVLRQQLAGRFGTACGCRGVAKVTMAAHVRAHAHRLGHSGCAGASAARAVPRAAALRRSRQCARNNVAAAKNTVTVNRWII